MDSETQAQLAEAERHAAAYAQLLQQAESGRAAVTEGKDSTGSVEVSFGRFGVPVSVRIGPDWQRTVGSQRLGAAVMQACLVPADLPLDVVPHEVSGTRPQSGQTPPPRQIEAIVADVIRVLGEATSAELSLTATGTAAMGRVEVTVSRDGVLSCDIDAAWAARQDAAALSAALTEAFAAAADSLERTAGDDPAAGLDALYEESIALLGQLRRERP